MANRRVSELNELLKYQVDPSDLFLIADISAIESKKIRASELKSYSLDGTASYAINSFSSSHSTIADSASWSPSVVSASYALSASYADFAKTASYVISASYALSSSWASRSLYSITASYALTSSVQLVISSARSTFADSASYLIFTPGFNNGTASAAISASWSRIALTASYLNYTGILNGTASYALTSSRAITSSFTNTASFLYNNGVFNGSASYAVQAENAFLATYTSNAMVFDVYAATLTSTSESRIPTMSLTTPYNGAGFCYTFVTFTTNVIMPYTSSVSGSITLAVKNQLTNAVYVFDYAPLTQSFYGGSGLISGSITVPLTLQGAQNLAVGNYFLYATASTSNIYFDQNRTSRFKIESTAQSVATYI